MVQANAGVRRRQAWDAGALPVALAALAAGVGLATFAWADGGFFPSSWRFGTVALAAGGGALLLVRDRLELDRLDLGFFAAVVAVAIWIGLSGLWSQSASDSLLELERALLYVVAVAVLLVAADRRSAAWLLAGCAAGVTCVSVYSLGARLFPGRPLAEQEASLSGPVGYANALGIFIVSAILLLLAAATQARRPAVRSAAAAALVPLAVALLFTASRGATLALLVGIAAVLALAPAPLERLAQLTVVVAAALVAAGLALASPALRDQDAPLSDTARQGHRLAAALVVLALVAAVLGRYAPRVRGVWAGRLAAAAALAVGVGVLVAASIAARASGTTVFGDRPYYWHAAWAEYERHPELGTGAGTFHRYWDTVRPHDLTVLATPWARDAHSLYLESLSELGPFGLALVLAMLGVPVAALLRTRADPLAAAAGPPYLAYLGHAGIDWDWEMPAVTLLALVAATAILAAARGRDSARPVRVGRSSLGVCLLAAAAFSIVRLLTGAPS